MPEFDSLTNLTNNLLEATARIHALLGKYSRIMIQCQSGRTRGPTLLIAYLCLYAKSMDWQKPSVVYKQMRKLSQMHPNMKAVVKLCKENRQLQYKNALDVQQLKDEIEEEKRQEA